MSRNANFAKTNRESVVDESSADVAARYGLHVLVIVVEHDGVVCCEKLLNCRGNCAFTGHDLVSNFRVDRLWRGDGIAVQINGGADAGERKGNWTKRLARALMDSDRVAVRGMRQDRPWSDA